MFDLVKRDLRRYLALDFDKPSLSNKIWVALLPQFQVVASYRFGRWVRANVKSRVARLPLIAAQAVVEKGLQVAWGMRIHRNADIGGGLYIGHPGCLLIGPCKMGEDCNVGLNNVIGQRTDGGQGESLPTIGNRVWFGVGAIVFGAVSIGDGTSIGPLTVVGRNVGPRSLVMGNPMKVISTSYDNARQIYGFNASGADGKTEGSSLGGPASKPDAT